MDGVCRLSTSREVLNRSLRGFLPVLFCFFWWQPSEGQRIRARLFADLRRPNEVLSGNAFTLLSNIPIVMNVNIIKNSVIIYLKIICKSCCRSEVKSISAVTDPNTSCHASMINLPEGTFLILNCPILLVTSK